MGAKGDGQIIGYKYYLGMHLGLWVGPADAIKKIFYNKKTAWTDTGPDRGAILNGDGTGGEINIYAPELLGGEGREGGISGPVDVEMGDGTQGVNAYLDSQLTGNIPAFRGVTCLVFKHCYFGNNPYIKNISARAVRTQTGLDYSPIWYQAKADISGDCNPAHIVYECLTSDAFDLGYPASMIDTTNFQAVADQLYTEGFGLSIGWYKQEKVENFIQLIMNHINGMVYVSPLTGQFTMKLIRDDYNPATLPVFDESNVIQLDSFERRGWGETINEISLVYRDKEDNNKKTVTVQDIANIQFQGGVVSRTLQMPGISNEDLATRVAFRELQAVSSPLSRIKFRVNRAAWDKTIGDVFKFSWQKLGVTEQVYRIVKIDTGRLKSGQITIDAVEDVFGMPSAVYTKPQVSGWVDPSQNPSDLTRQRVVEANYWDVQMSVPQADIAQMTAGFGFLVSMGSKESQVNYGYKLMTHVGANDYQNRGTYASCPSVIVDDALVQENSTTFNYSSAKGLDLVGLNTYAYIEDEIVEITAIDTGAGTITVNRGVLDTVPVAHAAGKIAFFSENWLGEDKTEYTDTDVVYAKLLEATGNGYLDIADATELSVTMANRYAKPYPPGNVKLNSNVYPSSTSGDIVITWSHRDRTQQLAYLVNQTEGNIGPEAGITYTIRIYDDATSTLKHTQTGETGTTWTYTQAARQTDFGGAGPHSVRVEIEANNAGLASWQAHKIVFSANDV